MKKIFFISFLFLVINSRGLCNSYTITDSGFSFLPDSISANTGDTIIFALSALHSAVEVSAATWNVNGNTSNGGFDVPLGGGMVVVDQAKTYFYVCGLHYYLGMKGRIFVSTASGVRSLSNSNPKLVIWPNPTTGLFTIQTNGAPAATSGRLIVLDASGRSVFDKEMSSGFRQLDLSGLAAGVYFVQLRYGEMILERKLMIAK